jgi:hypothetical protein
VAFVRTKSVGDHEYRQLVENYRENGHHRQRVLAHLGHADTVEGAIEDARRKLADLDASRLTEHIAEADRQVLLWERGIHTDYGERLARYHDGEIPTPAEVAKRTGTDKTAPVVAEVEVEGYFGTYKKPVYGEVPIPPEVVEYCRAFGDGTVEDRNAEHPDRHGHTVYYPDLSRYESWIDRLHYLRETAAKKSAEYERRSQYYLDRIEKLEQVARSLSGD